MFEMHAIQKGLKSLKKLAESTSGESSFLRLKDGQSVTIRFIQELDENGKHYDEKRGLAVSVFEHVSPDDNGIRFLCTMEDEGRCVGCERVVLNPRWKRRTRLYVNAYVVDEQKVKVVATGFSAKGIGGALVDYAEDFGTICDRNFKLKRAGEGFATSYSLLPREPSKFDFDSAEVISLDMFTKYRSYEDCSAMISANPFGKKEDSDW